MTKPVLRLGNLQLKILRVLWDRREATVADVYNALLTSSDLAYTTIATMLRKMEARGLVGHRCAGRTFVYKPVVSAEAVTAGVTQDVVERFFSGSLAAMMKHLLNAREVSRAELSALEKVIAEHNQRT